MWTVSSLQFTHPPRWLPWGCVGRKKKGPLHWRRDRRGSVGEVTAMSCIRDGIAVMVPQGISLQPVLQERWSTAGWSPPRIYRPFFVFVDALPSWGVDTVSGHLAVCSEDHHSTLSSLWVNLTGPPKATYRVQPPWRQSSNDE